MIMDMELNMKQKFNDFVLVLSKLLSGNEWKTDSIHCKIATR